MFLLFYSLIYYENRISWSVTNKFYSVIFPSVSGATLLSPALVPARSRSPTSAALRRAILGNPDVKHTTPWIEIMRNDFWGTPLSDSGSHGSYRPLCVLTYKLNHWFGGYRPIAYHLVNVLLHCQATVLVVKIARHLLPSRWGTLIAGVLFASHPIHTEAVAGIVGRADLAACNFYLLAFLVYCRHCEWRQQKDNRSWPALVCSIAFAIAAVLCKETAITALVVCGLYDIIRITNGQRDKVCSQK